MGTWDSSIFGDDIACDVRDHYRELIEDGVDDAEATRQTAEKFEEWFDALESGTSALVGFAVTQSKIGRLDPAIRDRALALIDRGGDLEIWASDNPKELGKRRAALEKARAQLTGPQPARKRLKPPTLVLCHLVAGDVLALDLPGGPVLIRTMRVRPVPRYGEEPIVEELEFNGPEVPPAEIIQQLPAKAGEVGLRYPTTAMHHSKKGGWKEAGFRKVANIPAKPGDEIASPDNDIFWWALAWKYRKRGDARPI